LGTETRRVIRWVAEQTVILSGTPHQLFHPRNALKERLPISFIPRRDADHQPGGSAPEENVRCDPEGRE
jgi:hypothetical protein